MTDEETPTNPEEGQNENTAPDVGQDAASEGESQTTTEQAPPDEGATTPPADGDPPTPPGCPGAKTVGRDQGPLREVTLKRLVCTKVFAVDEPAFDANHKYDIVVPEEGDKPGFRVLANIDFQKGPAKEHGHNGIQNEDLIVIVIDRLQSLQRGQFPCAENVEAAKALTAALGALNRRRADRESRDVDGTSQP